MGRPAADPRAAQGLLMLAMSAGEKRDFQSALQLLGQARLLDPANPELAFRQGLAQRELGDEQAALASFDAALALAPGHPAVMNARGLAFKALGRNEEALAAYDAALARSPRFGEALNNRGVVLRLLGRVEEAAASFHEAAAVLPGAAEVHNNLGWTLHRLARFDEALGAYSRALQLRPSDAQVLSNQGATLHELRRFDEAVACFEQALKVESRAWQTLMNLGVARYGQGRYQEALAAYQQAEALAPGEPDLALNRGNVLLELGRIDEALVAYEQVRAARPQEAEVEMNIGNAWREARQHERARPHYERALALAPESADVHFNFGLSLLAGGEYARGWPENEWRWKARQLGQVERRFDLPKWLGQEPLQGKTLLLHAEQGLGDTLLLCRYAPLVAAQGARVLLQVQKPLLALLREALAGVEVLGPDDALPPFDLHCPLMSLPLAFGTTVETIPGPVPYLRPSPERVQRWRERLPQDRPNVGLAWSGNPGFAADRKRSLPLALLLPALPEGVHYWCLQKDVPEQDRAAFDQKGIRRFDENLFPDTAAQMVSLDRVVTVDTSIANLAGALGCPTLLLLGSSADFRWLTGPWYPTVSLLRQEQAGDWEAPLDRLQQELSGLPREGGDPERPR